MSGILSSIAKNGWRETFRILCDDHNKIIKQPSKPRHRYVHIRNRATKKRKSHITIYRLANKLNENGRKSKTYHRVDKRDSLQDADAQKIVTATRHISPYKRQSQRTLKKDKRERKAIGRLDGRDAGREGRVPDSYQDIPHIFELATNLNVAPKILSITRALSHTAIE